MDWVALATAALETINLTLGLVSEHQRTRFKREYHEILEELDQLRNADPKDWNDAALGAAELKLMRFLEAYHSEIRAAKVADLRQGEGRSGEES